MNGLLVVVLEDHIRTHLTEAYTTNSDHGRGGGAREQLIEAMHSYFK